MSVLIVLERIKKRLGQNYLVPKPSSQNDSEVISKKWNSMRVGYSLGQDFYLWLRGSKEVENFRLKTCLWRAPVILKFWKKKLSSRNFYSFLVKSTELDRAFGKETAKKSVGEWI